MPTENRSSNTEMVSDKLPPCADDVFKNGVSACLVGDVPKHAAETICQSLSAVTGWKIDWHYFGGRTHIKALAPAPQPHPEPIAWMVGTAIWWTKEEAEKDSAAMNLPVVGLGPMTGAATAKQHQGEPVALQCWSCRAAFTLKDRSDCDGCCWKCGVEIDLEDYAEKFAGEVERCEARLHEVASLCASVEQERDTLRAQLGELVSAVRSINFGPAHAVQVRGDDEPCYPQRKEWVEWLLGLCDAASAEPSAPVERDEREQCAICRDLARQCMECEEAEFRECADRYFAATDYRKTDAGVFIRDWMRHAYAAWCARAALERKPS